MLTGKQQSEIAPLLRMSARIGADPLLVQAGTGNTSIKVDGTLWIKSSGKWLAHAISDDILVPVIVAEVQECVRLNMPIDEKHVSGGNRLKPSIETAMHAVI